jgi:VWFA-related protein
MNRALLYAAVLLTVFRVPSAIAQTQPPAPLPQQPAVPTLEVTSRLVFLDVTVLDKKGHPVVTGLTKDDFLITEEKKPERIFSFEPPDVHTTELRAANDNPDGRAPVTIFALDLLNSSFPDFAYIRYEVRRYLKAQPHQLPAPAELVVVGNQSLQLVQSWTRNREELLEALAEIPAALPYKEMNGSFWGERIAQSFNALDQIALENQGIPGRKNIVWVGHGAPGIKSAFFPQSVIEQIQQLLRDTTNMLVDDRISLFVIYPGLRGLSSSALDSQVDLGDNDPFASDINFGVLVNETGGKLFYNRNDVDQEMRESQILGSEYYTLTYQPHDGNDDGRFRRIRVTLRNPNLRAITKTGYFAPDKNARTNPQQQSLVALSQAAYSTIPFSGLDLSIGNVIRHPDVHTAQFTVFVQPKNLAWLSGANGTLSANLSVAAVSLSADRSALASRIEITTELAPTLDATRATDWPIRIPFTLRIPRKTRSVRVVVQTEPGGRMGSAEIDRQQIEGAPAQPNPEPGLSGRTPQPPATP